MTRFAAFLAACLVAATPLFAKEPSAFDEIVKKTPAATKIKVGRAQVGDLYTWKVDDVRSPYYGLTLVWLVVDDDDASLAVEKTNGVTVPTTPVDAKTIAVLSGGGWSGRSDSRNWAKHEAAGLVIAKGAPVQRAKALPAGGVLVACGDNVEIYDSATYARKYPANQLPCAGVSALQSDTLLLRDGKLAAIRPDAKSNRLAIGSDTHKILIAGAFNSLGSALSLADFGKYLDSLARLRGFQKMSAVNLDGGCSAQLLLPPLANRQFGCRTAGFNINRIVLRFTP